MTQLVPRWILGVHYGHDANAALLRDGQAVWAIAEERLNRTKLSEGFPLLSVAWALQQAGLRPDEIELVAVCGASEPLGSLTAMRYAIAGTRERPVPLGWRLLSHAVSLTDNLLPFLRLRLALNQWIVRRTVRALGFSRARIRFVDHALAHAASAYYASGWTDEERVLVVSVDGKGDGLSHRTCVAERGRLRTVARTRDYDSIGYLYLTATKHLGFIPLRHEGKVTGLAAFGRGELVDRVPCPVRVDGALRFRSGLIGLPWRLSRYLIYARLLVTRPRLLRELLCYSSTIKAHFVKQRWLEFYQAHFNHGQQPREEVAAYAQAHLERTIVELVRQSLRTFGRSALCVAGGVFANVKLNQRLQELPEVERFYVQPAMGDGGLSLGAAWHAWAAAHPRDARVVPPGLPHVYLGTGYSDAQIEAALRADGLPYRRSAVLAEDVAEALAAGKIVGLFTGRMEWGPRALGARSILAHPKDRAVNDWLNRRLRRSEFMPFAPSVLAEDAAEYFLRYRPSQTAARFMTVTYDVEPSLVERVAGVVHVDRTARPQVVFREDHPLYYDIIAAFKRRTGTPMVINTSFNIHEEPIIHSPADAIRAFRQGAVDLLAVGPFLVDAAQVSGIEAPAGGVATVSAAESQFA